VDRTKLSRSAQPFISKTLSAFSISEIYVNRSNQNCKTCFIYMYV